MAGENEAKFRSDLASEIEGNVEPNQVPDQSDKAGSQGGDSRDFDPSDLSNWLGKPKDQIPEEYRPLVDVAGRLQSQADRQVNGVRNQADKEIGSKSRESPP